MNNTKIGKRIFFKKNLGTIRYNGKLQHPVTSDKIDTNAEWLGIEWDDATNGKHNGTVSDFEYFKCEKDSDCGSIVKASKVDMGVDFIRALIEKYFKEHEVNEIMKHRDDFVDYLQARFLKE